MNFRTLTVPILTSGLLLSASLSQAIITNGSINATTIPYETVGTPKDVIISYTVAGITSLNINIFRLRNFSDVPSVENQVAQINQNNVNTGTYTYTWSALWLLGDDLGRQDGRFQIILEDVSSTPGPSFTVSDFLQITSVDIHNVTVSPSRDGNDNPALPYIISYSLAKDSLVTVRVKDTNNTVVRTIGATDAPQFGETVKSTNTVIWNGLDDSSKPVPLGIYTVEIDARDPVNTDVAITRTRTATIQTLANIDSDAKTTFQNNSYVYPNPIRDGQTIGCGALTVPSVACFQLYPVRNNSTIYLKIYTLAGDLVLDKSFPNLTTGNIESFAWDMTNQSGKKLARGLYYYVLREEDSEGTLQVTKKLAVIR